MSLINYGRSYPVDLIEVVGLQDGSAHDSDAVGGSHLHFDITEEDIGLGFNGRGIAPLTDHELGTEIGACHRSGGCVPAIKGRVS